MIKDCNEKLTIFNELITQETEDLIKFVFSPKNFPIYNIHCFTEYIIQKLFITYSEDFKFSIKIMLYESILNSFYHGNLNIVSKIKEKENGFEEFEKLIKKRLKNKKYSTKKIYLTIKLETNKIILNIKDEGNGFNYSNLNIDNYKTYGRGIKLIKAHSNKIYWNEKGNEITIEKNING